MVFIEGLVHLERSNHQAFRASGSPEDMEGPDPARSMQGPNFERSHDGRSFGGRGRKGGFGGPPDDGFGPPFGSFDGSIATLMLRSEDNAELMSRLLKILTPDQREKWNELTGPDFKAAIE